MSAEKYPLDLPAYLALNAPEADLDAIYAHVQRITGETRSVIASNLWNPHGQTQHGSYGRNVNVHGTPYYHGRKATFVVDQGRHIESAAMDYSGPEYEYGWEVVSPTVLDDGSFYRSAEHDAGSISWQRLD